MAKGMMACPGCGKSMKVGATKCPGCGMKMAAPKVMVKKASPGKMAANMVAKVGKGGKKY